MTTNNSTDKTYLMVATCDPYNAKFHYVAGLKVLAYNAAGNSIIKWVMKEGTEEEMRNYLRQCAAEDGIELDIIGNQLSYSYDVMRYEVVALSNLTEIEIVNFLRYDESLEELAEHLNGNNLIPKVAIEDIAVIHNFFWNDDAENWDYEFSDMNIEDNDVLKGGDKVLYTKEDGTFAVRELEDKEK